MRILKPIPGPPGWPPRFPTHPLTHSPTHSLEKIMARRKPPPPLVQAAAILERIDPTERQPWIDASIALRSIGLEAQETWLRWSEPLALPEDVIVLWQNMPTRVHDPLRRLERIAVLEDLARRRAYR
jgi:hypothetical protein